MQTSHVTINDTWRDLVGAPETGGWTTTESIPFAFPFPLYFLCVGNDTKYKTQNTKQWVKTIPLSAALRNTQSSNFEYLKPSTFRSLSSGAVSSSIISTEQKHSHTHTHSVSLNLVLVLASMAVCDAVVSNLTTIYVAVIACVKVYGLVCGRSFSAGFIVIASTTVVGLILAATLTWDVSRKATCAFARRHHSLHVQSHEMCKGGICWHGVAVRSPASQVRFRLPQQIPYAAF